MRILFTVCLSICACTLCGCPAPTLPGDVVQTVILRITDRASGAPIAGAFVTMGSVAGMSEGMTIDAYLNSLPHQSGLSDEQGSGTINIFNQFLCFGGWFTPPYEQCEPPIDTDQVTGAAFFVRVSTDVGIETIMATAQTGETVCGTVACVLFVSIAAPEISR
jgi:hypothetical protein